MSSGRIVGLVCFLCTLFPACVAYKPVILMHGITNNEKNLTELISFINDSHPGTKTWSIPMYDDTSSEFNLWQQTSRISKKIMEVTSSDPDYADGYHLLCHSQGALICRTFLQTNDHNVDTFVSLAGPHMGVYGYLATLRSVFPESAIKGFWRILYDWPLEPLLQNIAALQLWHDPAHEEEYLKGSEFVPVVNNLAGVAAKHVKHSPIPPSEYRANLLKVKHIVLCGSPADEAVMPWQVTHFQTYAVGDLNHTEVVGFTESEEYQQDTFGLKTLHTSGRLTFVTEEGVAHRDWLHTRSLYDRNMEPWLN